VVVAQRQLVAHEQHRDPALAEGDGVGQQEAGHGLVEEGGIAGVEGVLDPGQAGGGAARAPVAGGDVVLEHEAPANEPGNSPA
jgi:hypothetical protein